MNATETNFDSIILETFRDVYFCHKSWSAWSYDTMKMEDFSPIFEEEDLLQEFKIFLFKNKKIDIDSLLNYLSEIEGYFNDNFDYNFSKEYFYEDWLEYIDLEEFIQTISPILLILRKEKNIRCF